ncbi:hypothetical protein SAY86_018093 [Trapa natans]|uniref:Exocyst subunit Exo70 family protein n=1 Tax=Trapa natans TaxID=22666 RepID=A0AAN7R0R4_TRANT|nr:hypothetical protein SAY86_018093 [Trapa natans]
MIMKSPFSRPSTSSCYQATTRYNPLPSPMHYKFSYGSPLEENVEIAEALINKWDTAASDRSEDRSLFLGNRYEAKMFLTCIKNLHAAMSCCIGLEDSDSHMLGRAQKLIETAMKRLEKELHDILSTNEKYLDQESISSWCSRASMDDEDFRFVPSPSDQREEERVSSAVMADLKAIADCMITSGFGKECMKIYNTSRKSIFNKAMYDRGLDRSLTASEIQKMDCKSLERKIRGWLRAVRVSFRTIFLSEQILCDHVFAASLPIRQSCFSEITREGALALFSFAESVAAKSKKLPVDKVFYLLDMYEAIATVLPEIEFIFSDNYSTSDIPSQAKNSLIDLGDAIGPMLTDLESAIEKESSKFPVPGGCIHPLTHNVINYLTRLSDYNEVLPDIIAEWSLKGRLMVLLLLCKLNGQAELQKDLGLSYLFLVNNLHYVVSKARKSNLMDILGYELLAKYEAKVKQHVESYEAVVWVKVIKSLPVDDLDSAGVKDCFRRFNMEFESAYQKQLSCNIHDPKLRDEIKMSLMGKLLPAYTALYNSHGTEALRREEFRESVVRYSPEDLRDYLSDLFRDKGSQSSSSSCRLSKGKVHLRPVSRLVSGFSVFESLLSNNTYLYKIYRG